MGSPPWLKNAMECLGQYDSPNHRRWFLAHSGVPAHFVAHVGNPGACMDGGHKFFWGLLVVQINLAGNPWQAPTMSDVALEYTICVPKICQYAVVDAVLVPFYLGPYLGKPWGPSPEFLYRFKHLGGDDATDPDAGALQASASAWMASVMTKSDIGEFYTKEWPFRRELWEYEKTWWPSPRNEAVLASLSFPPLLAGLVVFCLGCLGLKLPSSDSATARVQVNGSSENVVSNKGDAKTSAPSGGSTAIRRAVTAVSRVTKAYAPQTHIQELTAPIHNDLVGMHVLRILLQIMVCWQHTILIVEWLGTAGHHGIASFLPITNDISRVMGRVNTTFACLTVHLSLQSVIKTLAAADKRVAGGTRMASTTSAPPSEPVASNGRKPQQASPTAATSNNDSQTTVQATTNGNKRNGKMSPTSHTSAETCEPVVAEVPAASVPRAIVGLWLWVVRRWVRQVGELGLWTFYFNELSQDIPWKPFPDFVQVWYRDRAVSCRRWLAPEQHQLPMWLLSLFFVYEPVNSVLRLHRPPVSLCHNMQVFENLFTLSVFGGFLGVVRHCFGKRALVSAAVLFTLMAVRQDPPWMIKNNGDDDEVGWDMVIYSTLQMLPAAVTTALLLSEVWPESQVEPKHRGKHGCVAVLALSASLDFINCGHAPLLGAYIPFTPLRKLVVAVFGLVLQALEALPTPAFFLREGLHALGIALLVRSFKPASIGESFPGWARGISRLSLSINLTNIFAIHYLRGRLLDHPVEFSHVHGILYALFAWVAAIVASLVAHCMVAPYVTAADTALSWFGRVVFAPKGAGAKKQV